MSTFPAASVRAAAEGLRSTQALERTQAAQAIADYYDTMTLDQIDELAPLLVEAALRESETEALAAELDALYLLTTYDTVDRTLVARIDGVDRSILLPNDLEWVDRLLGYARGYRT